MLTMDHILPLCKETFFQSFVGTRQEDIIVATGNGGLSLYLGCVYWQMESNILKNWIYSFRMIITIEFDVTDENFFVTGRRLGEDLRTGSRDFSLQ